MTIRDVGAADKLFSSDNVKSYGRGYVSLSYDIDVKQAGSHEVVFANTNTEVAGKGPQRLFVDIVKISSAAVPEPSSAIFIFLGGASLLFSRKRGIDAECVEVRRLDFYRWSVFSPPLTKNIIADIADMFYKFGADFRCDDLFLFT